MPVIFPSSERRQRHENGFSTSARLQTERCTAVVYQIEFDITPATIQLELTFAIAPLRAGATRNDRQVRVEKMVTNAALIGVAALEAPLVQVVKEQPADATGFVAMLEK